MNSILFKDGVLTNSTVTSGIYFIFNKSTHRYYIGRSNNLQNRISDHFITLANNDKKGKFQHDYNRYGINSFVVFLLEEVIPSELIKMEKHYLNDYWGDMIYNFVNDSIGFGYGKNNIVYLDGVIEKISKALSNRKISDETRKKLSAANSGENNPMYGRRGVNSPLYGSKMSDELKKYMSSIMIGNKYGIGNKSRLGKKLSKEEVEFIRARMVGNKYALGLKHSDESKNLISKNSRRRKVVEKYDLKNNLLQTFNTMYDAAVSVGVYCQILSGKFKGSNTVEYKGFIWIKRNGLDRIC